MRSAIIRISLLLSAALFISAGAPSSSARPWKVTAYIQSHLYLAKELHLETGIPVPFILAVAGLESDWGRSELARHANNHFGLKVKPEWRGLQYCKQTQEFSGLDAYQETACFRKYPLIRRSYQDFGRFITARKNYQATQGLSVWDYQGWAEAIQQGGYATDPEYAQKLRGIIWRYQLSEFQLAD